MHPTTWNDARFVFDAWHERTRAGDIDRLLDLYLPGAELESPLVPRVMDTASGIITGRAALREFFERGTLGRPDASVRFHREDVFLFDRGRLIWEYPRATPDGNQVDLVEVMDLEGPRIRHHRIYWGWYGVPLLQQSRR